MMSLRIVACLVLVLLVGSWICSPAAAQSAGTVYTWTHLDGGDDDASDGASTEGWGQNGGANTITLNNTNDGVLGWVESSAGLGFTLQESFNRAKEGTGAHDHGSYDFTGLSSLEFVNISHNGTSPVNGQIFVQPYSGAAGCCGFFSKQITVNPGVPLTDAFDLSSLSDQDIAGIRSIGIQIYDGHGNASPLTWSLDEVRSTGDSLMTRTINDHTGGGLEGAVADFEQSSIQDNDGGQNQTGMNNVGGALRWVDLGGQGGAAVKWPVNGRDGLLGDAYETRPADLSNYQFVTVTMRAQDIPLNKVPSDTVDVQFFVKATSGFNYQSPLLTGDLTLTADEQFHELTWALGGMANMDALVSHGINLHGHPNNLDIRVQSIRYWSIPEPSSVALLLVGGVLCLLGRARKRS